MRIPPHFVCLFTLLFALLPGAAVATPVPLTRVRLQLKWRNQFQFAGYYAAVEQGYYRKAGLKVDIVPGGPGIDVADVVLAGEAQFGVGTSELLLRRAHGDPVVVLAVIFQHSPLVLLARRGRGIQTIHDLAGKRVAIEPGAAELYAYLRREGVPIRNVDFTKHGLGIKQLLTGEVAAQSAYVTDEPYLMLKKGVPYQIYSPRADGIDFYGDNLFTTEKEIRLHPRLVRAFRAASLKGWAYAMRHQNEIIRLILKQYNRKAMPGRLRFEAHQMQELLATNLVEPGHMIPGRWRHIASVYHEVGMLGPHFSLKGFLYNPNPPPPDLTRLYAELAAALAAALLAMLIGLHIHRVNRRLAASERRFRTVFSSAPLAFVISDTRGRITDWNEAARNTFGWSQEEAVGHNLYTLLIPERLRATVRRVLDATGRDSGANHHTNANLTRTGGEIICQWSNAPHYDEHDRLTGVLSLGIDLTDRLRLERELREAKEQAEQALEEHRRFLGMISHELRSPIASISSARELLALHAEKGTAAPPQVVERIGRSVRRLSRFADDLFVEDRVSCGSWQLHPASVSLPPLLRSVAEEAGQANADHPIVLTVAPEVDCARFDPIMLRVLLLNLLENAAKYSPAGREVSLDARLAPEGTLVLEVADRGDGIDPAERESLFGKYIRGRRAGNVPGTGMGLYIVHRIARLHSGTVELAERRGGGTVARLVLPISGC